MNDRVHSLSVVLEYNIRSDDVTLICDAIRQLRGVLSVTTHVSDITTHMAEERARQHIGQQLMEILYPKEHQ